MLYVKQTTFPTRIRPTLDEDVDQEIEAAEYRYRTGEIDYLERTALIDHAMHTQTERNRSGTWIRLHN